MADDWTEKIALYPDSPFPLFAQLARAIRMRVVQWELEAGSALPTEQQLAERQGLSKETVRKAYAWLRDAGVIKSQRGKGWYVADRIKVYEVTPAPGSRVTTRALKKGDMLYLANPKALYLGTPLVVEEPGKPPVAYDPQTTVIVVAQVG